MIYHRNIVIISMLAAVFCDSLLSSSVCATSPTEESLQSPKEIIDFLLVPREVYLSPGIQYPGAILVDRIRNDPKTYASEIEGRLLSLLPDSLATEDEIAAFGESSHIEAIGFQMSVLLSLTQLLGPELAKPILLNNYQRADTLFRQAGPLWWNVEDEANNSPPAPARPSQRQLRLNAIYNGASTLIGVKGQTIETAGKLTLPIFVDDCIKTMEKIRDRPKNWLIANFPMVAGPYLLQFVDQRPDIYPRLERIMNTKFQPSSAADNLQYELGSSVKQMRLKLQAKGLLPPAP